ncbi:uncharacterized protein RCC_08024 [Ramularia collo-cygni]|uniref:Uncharacterized protein n=1 Tax=Ramularia collo-cygni TaxID=112498 RepID=A0A2D3V629_9PEZI|nr:uncharacterized protein RCC_08024 [Ramularia collo-cygni]CZT22155.1 uncharacterized protein RCC_08024 [Ramularia collo-cygni]
MNPCSMNVSYRRVAIEKGTSEVFYVGKTRSQLHGTSSPAAETAASTSGNRQPQRQRRHMVDELNTPQPTLSSSRELDAAIHTPVVQTSKYLGKYLSVLCRDLQV